MGYSETTSMSSGGGKPPQAPDPNVIIPLESQYNRWNSSGPFGSQSWSSGGPGGHETLTTNLSPQMQGAVDRAFQASQAQLTPKYIPQGLDQLASAMLGRIGSRYGLSGNGLNTNLQAQKPQSQSPLPPTMGGGMMTTNQPPSMGPPSTMPVGNPTSI